MAARPQRDSEELGDFKSVFIFKFSLRAPPCSPSCSGSSDSWKKELDLTFRSRPSRILSSTFPHRDCRNNTSSTVTASSLLLSQYRGVALSSAIRHILLDISETLTPSNPLSVRNTFDDRWQRSHRQEARRSVSEGPDSEATPSQLRSRRTWAAAAAAPHRAKSLAA